VRFDALSHHPKQIGTLKTYRRQLPCSSRHLQAHAHTPISIAPNYSRVVGEQRHKQRQYVGVKLQEQLPDNDELGTSSSGEMFNNGILPSHLSRQTQKK